ncbi:MAG: TfoX/Sxy family protein [Flavobacteriales bacterium]|nr:TfoX/Sxy family protein [Flavobacteriales bacterium]MEB2342209.1 TfoX/Sxy family protein [Flavobacteriia bacterium]
MSTRKETAAFILDELGRPDRFRLKPMFGEFALYADGKVVGFIVNDQLLLKILPESGMLEPLCEKAEVFPGSKDYYLVPEETITGLRQLPSLLLAMAEALPFPKKRTGRKRA